MGDGTKNEELEPIFNHRFQKTQIKDGFFLSEIRG